MNLNKIKCLIFDVDGVLTDGSLYYSEHGETLKRFNVKDGFALSLAKKAGFILCIITARDSAVVKKRAKDLKFDECFIGQHKKIDSYEIIKNKYNLKDDEISYVGDDLIDIEVLKQVAFSACPKDAAEQVRDRVNFVSNLKGGQGAVREIIEHILKKQNSFDKLIETYL